MTVRILTGDCRDTLRTLADASVQTCVTSPPYFGLRDYGHEGQIGLEPTPAEFVAKLVEVFREVRRVLRDDGTLWLNLGDSYYNTNPGSGGKCVLPGAGKSMTHGRYHEARRDFAGTGLKPKDLIGIPWRVAFALQADGWYLRQDIIWSKPNPMPESVRDRCTKAHEYLFLMSKSPRYYFDADAIAEPLGQSSIERLSQATLAQQAGSDRVPGKTNGTMKAVGRRAAGNKSHKQTSAYEAGDERMRTKAGLVSFAERERAKVDAGDLVGIRNKRTVWEIATQPFKGAHFATFPPALIEPCVLAGSKSGDVVLDPFGGAGTTGLVADRLGRDAVLCEINPAYAEIARNRITDDSPLFAEVAA